MSEFVDAYPNNGKNVILKLEPVSTAANGESGENWYLNSKLHITTSVPTCWIRIDNSEPFKPNTTYQAQILFGYHEKKNGSLKYIESVNSSVAVVGYEIDHLCYCDYYRIGSWVLHSGEPCFWVRGLLKGKK